MAVYSCQCGLIISTSSDRPQCLRCLRVLGPQDSVVRAEAPVDNAPAVVAEPPRMLVPVSLVLGSMIVR